MAPALDVNKKIGQSNSVASNCDCRLGSSVHSQFRLIEDKRPDEHRQPYQRDDGVCQAKTLAAGDWTVVAKRASN